MDRGELIDFARSRGLALIATRGPDASPQAALVGIGATDDGEIVFDCSRGSRKYTDRGSAQILRGSDLERCTAAHVKQYPDGRERAASPDMAHIRVIPRWLRYSDHRPATFGSSETEQ
jgi:hypothetical protein